MYDRVARGITQANPEEDQNYCPLYFVVQSVRVGPKQNKSQNRAWNPSEENREEQPSFESDGMLGPVTFLSGVGKEHKGRIFPFCGKNCLCSGPALLPPD